DWLESFETLGDAEADIGRRVRWEGLGLTGRLPDSRQVLSLDTTVLLPLVTDENGDVLAGYVADIGSYPVLANAANMPVRDPEELDTDTDRWPVVVIVEPDLANNYGLADAARAQAAIAIVEASL